MSENNETKSPKKFAVMHSFSYEEVHQIALDVMNLGMSLRQDQLNGLIDKSGNEVVSEYLDRFKQTNYH